MKKTITRLALASLVLLAVACDLETPSREGDALQSNWYSFHITNVSAAADDLLSDATVIYVHGELLNRNSETMNADLGFFLLETEDQNPPLAQPEGKGYSHSSTLAPGETSNVWVSFVVPNSKAAAGERLILGVDLGWTVASGYLPFLVPEIEEVDSQ